MNKRNLTRSQLARLGAAWSVAPLPDPAAIPAALWLVTSSIGSKTITDHKPSSLPAGYHLERITVKG